MKIAQEQKKPVMIDIYRDLCGNCKYMDQNTFTDPGVVELADRFVCIKVNLDRSGGESISARYGAYYGTLPFIIFLREDGSKVHQSNGLKYPEPFIQEMMVALNNA
jgi:thiol:disulfide interchange protein DsbD